MLHEDAATDLVEEDPLQTLSDVGYTLLDVLQWGFICVLYGLLEDTHVELQAE